MLQISKKTVDTKKNDSLGIVQEIEIRIAYQILYVQSIIHPREWDAIFSNFDTQINYLILHWSLVMFQRKKKMIHSLVDFSSPVDHWAKIRKSENIYIFTNPYARAVGQFSAESNKFEF